MLLRPSRETNELLGGVLARAVALWRVKLHGFIFTSNHLHLLVSAEGRDLSRFMQYLLSNIAKKIGRLVNWTGALWQRRFSAEPVLDDGAAEGRLKYILAHGVKEGLVARVRDWPGLSCLPQMLGAAKRVFRWFHWSRRWNRGRLKEGGSDLLSGRWAEPVELELHPIPSWGRLTPTARVKAATAMVQVIEDEGSARPRRLLGRRGVERQSPHSRPAMAKRTPRPLCHTSLRELRQSFLEAYRAFEAAYRRASERFRAGEPSIRFPPLAFRPPF